MTARTDFQANLTSVATPLWEKKFDGRGKREEGKKEGGPDRMNG